MSSAQSCASVLPDILFVTTIKLSPVPSGILWWLEAVRAITLMASIIILLTDQSLITGLFSVALKHILFAGNM